MAAEFIYRCALPSGLHARPCSHIAEITGRFATDATLTNRRNGRTANAKSVLALISADVLHGDECSFVFGGADEAEASCALREFLERDLAALEEPPVGASTSARILPRALRLANMPVAFGVPLSPGFGRGALLFAEGIRLPQLGGCEAAAGPEAEQRKVASAITRLQAELAHSAARATGAEAAIVRAHLAILRDSTFASAIAARIQQGDPAGDAILRTAHSFAETLAGSQSAYIRERVIDIQEVSLRLYEAIYGAWAKHALVLDAPTVLVAENLGAQELLKLDRALLKGIVFGDGQATSHAVILARSLGIPAIAGAVEVKRIFQSGDHVVLDGRRGYVVAATCEAQRFYAREAEAQSLQRKRLRQFASARGVTADGRRMEVGANVSSAEEVGAAFRHGCDGIGLFRTEMLFVGRDTPPSEAEQSAAYTRAVAAAQGKPVILRTFDVGGDKPVAFLKPSTKESPLGDRGILIYREHPEILQTQLWAMLRASAAGEVRIMIPLISTGAEIRWVKKQIAEARQRLVENPALPPAMKLGIMIELPEAVPRLNELAVEVDFFSVGTNDLAQYFFAQDRTRSKLDLRASVRHPKFLRLLREIAQQAKLHNKWLGMCGEMAGDARNLPLLIGLGLDEISLGGDVLAMKSYLAKLSASACEALLEKAVACESVEEVDALLVTFASATALPVVDRDLVIPASRSVTREEAIRELADTLHLHERTTDPDRLEDAIWEREATYPTDMGLGFALPHCKSDAVQHSAIAVLRPEMPFLWSAESTAPVRAVIMLAMKDEPGKHMQVLSKLARKLMDESFRERLLAFPDQEAAVELLTQEVGID